MQEEAELLDFNFKYMDAQSTPAATVSYHIRKIANGFLIGNYGVQEVEQYCATKADLITLMDTLFT